MEGKSPLFDDLQLFWGKRLEGTLYTPKRRTPIKPRRNANELNRFGRESLVKRFKMSFVSLSDVNRMRKSVVMDEGMSNLMESTQRKDLLRLATVCSPQPYVISTHDLYCFYLKCQRILTIRMHTRKDKAFLNPTTSYIGIWTITVIKQIRPIKF